MSGFESFEILNMSGDDRGVDNVIQDYSGEGNDGTYATILFRIIRQAAKWEVVWFLME